MENKLNKNIFLEISQQNICDIAQFCKVARYKNARGRINFWIVLKMFLWNIYEGLLLI